MLSQVCSFFPRFRKYSCVDRKFSFLVLGGVLLALGLAFISNNTYATGDIYQANTFTVAQIRLGCNVVNSFAGYMAVGPRGSITGADNNPSGCNYYLNNGNLTWRESSDYFTNNLTYDLQGSFYQNTNNHNMTNFSDDYLKYKFRSSVHELHSDWSSAIGYDTHIYQQDFDDPYGSYVSIFAIKWFDGLVHSNLNPTMFTTNYSGLTATQYEKFQRDTFDHTIYRCGDPRGYVNDFLYADLQSRLAGSLEDYCFIITYIPQYNFDYVLDDIHYSVDTLQSQETIDRNLGGFQQFEIGLGNSVGSETFPRLSYFALSNPYTANNNQVNDIIQSAYSMRYRCQSQTCFDQAVPKVKNLVDYHTNAINSFSSSSNPGGSWFDVFSGLSVINPFSAIFNSFTNSQCADIPIIAGMLSVNNTRYCSWWGSGVRQLLTPVFTISSMVLLFGFVIHWLRDGDRPIFSNQQIGGKK